MIMNEVDIKEISAMYSEWQHKIESLRSSQTALSEKELSSLQKEGIAIQHILSLRFNINRPLREMRRLQQTLP